VIRVATIMMIALLAGSASAQHMHGNDEIPGSVGAFYETWTRPDMPHVSCCNRMDCAPVSEVRQINGRWSARRKSDGKWLSIPPEKVEQNRDSPDGRSHMCSMGEQVFCFVAGFPAKVFVTAEGLERKWEGSVWMNPPFGPRNGLVPWLAKFFDHADGVALVPDRTSAPWWQAFAPRADLILFVAPKLKFIGADGQPGASPAQGTCLFGKGVTGRGALTRAAAAGLGILAKPQWVGTYQGAAA